MHIVHVVDRFTPTVGGVELSVQHTAAALARRGHRVTVITEHAGPQEEEVHPSGFRICRFPRPYMRPLTALAYWRLMWILRGEWAQADVLHFHDHHTLLFWFGPLRFIRRRSVYAITFHGFEGWPIRRWHRMLRHIAARVCHVRFGVGEYLRVWYGHPIDQCFIGAPIPGHSGAETAPVEADFAYAGRLEPDTGIAETLRALRDASLQAGTVRRARIAGRGSLAADIAALDTDLFRIEMHGTVLDTSTLFASARVVIATGFLAILSAFAAGCSVVIPAYTVIKRSYIRSIPGIDDMAWVAETPAECARIAEEVLAGAEHAAARRACAGAFVSALSWDDIARIHEQAYSSATRRHHRP